VEDRHVRRPGPFRRGLPRRAFPCELGAAAAGVMIGLYPRAVAEAARG